MLLSFSYKSGAAAVLFVGSLGRAFLSAGVSVASTLPMHSLRLKDILGITHSGFFLLIVIYKEDRAADSFSSHIMYEYYN
jgi:hypothetical protein